MLFQFSLFQSATAQLSAVLQSTQCETSRRLAVLENILTKCEYIIQSCEIQELRVRTHNVALSSLEQRYRMCAPDHRDSYLQYFQTAESDIQGHGAEKSFYQKWESLDPSIHRRISRTGSMEYVLKYEAAAKHLLSQYHRSDNIRLLADSIDAIKIAISWLPNGAMKEAILLKDNLVTKLGQIAEATWSPAVIREALSLNETCQKDTEKLPAKDQPLIRARILNHGGLLWKIQAVKDRNVKNYDRAIVHFEEALSHASQQPHLAKSAALRANILNEIANCLLMRSNAMGGSKANINKAFRLIAQSHKILNTSQYHAVLSNTFYSRYNATGHVPDLSSAVVAGAKAIFGTSTMDPNYSGYLAHLGNLYLHGYETFRTKPTLKFVRHPTRQRLRNIIDTGNRQAARRAMRIRVKRVVLRIPTRRVADLRFAYRLFQQAVISPGFPSVRLSAAGKLGLVSCHEENWEVASMAFRTALTFLPKAVPRITPFHQSLSMLSNFFGLSSLAASAILQSGQEPVDALDALESGRCYAYQTSLKSHQLSDSKPPLAPDLSNMHAQLQNQLAVSRKSDSTSVDLVSFSDLIKGMSHLEIVEKEIGNQPGFENLKQRLSKTDIKDLAEEGAIVCFLVNQAGNYIIVVTKDSIRERKLEGLDEHKLDIDVLRVNGSRSIMEGDGMTIQERGKLLDEILANIWELAVRPALEELGLLRDVGSSPLPRIWWLASGPVGLLPIHAAGGPRIDNVDVSRRQRGKERTDDFVMSSYIPSLRMLREARRRRSILPHRCYHDVLIVAMPETAGHSDLSTVEDEIVSIQHTLESAGWPRAQVLKYPSKIEVIEELNKCNIVIFACHGIAHRLDPSMSGILLKAQEGASPDCLTVRDLENMDLKNARLACLLACSTSHNSARWLWDECVHVAGGFQLAGFPEVVATICPVQDRVASNVTQLLMKKIVECGEASSFAPAFHTALREVKKKNKNVIEWSPFIHLGT